MLLRTQVSVSSSNYLDVLTCTVSLSVIGLKKPIV